MDSGLFKRGGWGRALATGFSVSTALGVLLGVIGPFGSYMNGGLLERVVYWVMSLWVGWALFGLVVPWIAYRPALRRVPVWLWAPVVVALLTVPATMMSRMLARTVWPDTGRVPWLEWYGQSLVISAVATGLVLWWISRSGEDAVQTRDPRDRLPAGLGREILCLQMEDHYVRVHTPRGSTLVLMSLSQAMAGLADIEGARTHRSWWVARAAVEGVVEDGRNLRLKLTGGLEAPVSRARVGELRAEGWFND
jgi:hypothetical protein